MIRIKIIILLFFLRCMDIYGKWNFLMIPIDFWKLIILDYCWIQQDYKSRRLRLKLFGKLNLLCSSQQFQPGIHTIIHISNLIDLHKSLHSVRKESFLECSLRLKMSLICLQLLACNKRIRMSLTLSCCKQRLCIFLQITK